MAEAVLNRKGAGRFAAHSAGARPADRVHPLAVWAMQEVGIEWRGHGPKSVAGLEAEPWDFVITLCDRARESCPSFPGQPVVAHWGMEDPAAVAGTEEMQRAAFVAALGLISRRIDLILALPIEKLERLALEHRVRAIGQAGTPADALSGRVL
jgi:arsenate reductase